MRCQRSRFFSGRDVYRPIFPDHLLGAKTRQGDLTRLLPTIHIVVDEPRGYSLAFLIKNQASVPNVVISSNGCKEYVRDLIELGASLVVPPVEFNSLWEWVQRIFSGQSFILQSGVREPLPRRDRAILRGIALGLTNKQIAKELSLCDQTIKNGLSRILAEIMVRNRVEAALYYWGLLGSAQTS